MINNQLSIGSLAGNDIVIQDAGIAEQHGILYLDDGKVCLELYPGCMATLNGNEVVEGRYWLQDTDVVVVGSSRLKLNLIGMALEAQAYDPMTDGPLSSPVGTDADLSDAVEMRRNPWPAIIFAAILIAVGVFFGLKMRSYHQERQAIEAKAKATQDSINAAMMRIDTLQNKLKELENI